MYGFPMTSECLSFELPSMSLFDRSEKSHAKAMFVSREKNFSKTSDDRHGISKKETRRCLL